MDEKRIQVWEEIFENHEATFYDYGKLKMVDFKKPDSIEHRIRFIFEEDYCRLHISGSFGELIAANYYNMTFEKFAEYLNDSYYFEQKIRCMSQQLYYYSQDKARKEIWNAIQESGLDVDDIDEMDDVIEDILRDIDEDTGIESRGLDKYEELVGDDYYGNHCEEAYRLGETRTEILYVYLLAFKLAVKQLKERGVLKDGIA